MTNEQRLLALEILTWASLASSKWGFEAESVQDAYMQWRRDPQEWRFDALLQLADIRSFPGMDR